MKLKIVVVATLLSSATLAHAGAGCSTGHREPLASCAEGTVWNISTLQCEPVAS